MHDHSEEARLSALQQLGLLDTDPSESFDRITRMASQLFGLPIAAVSLTDRDRQWFKSRVGVEHNSIPRMKAPCAEVAETSGILVVPDMLEDACYRDSLLAESGIRFYAGAPLTTREGFCLGAMCVLGTEPRAITPQEASALKDLAAMVMSQIELQHAFGRIDPTSGLPNRVQFEEDLLDLARDRPEGERYLAVLVDLATAEELNQAVRVLGSSYLDELNRDAAAALKAALGPTRKAYQVGLHQFAFLSPPSPDEAAYTETLRGALTQARMRASARFIRTSVIGLAPFAMGEVAPANLLRMAQSAVQDARISGERVAIYSAAHDHAHQRRFTLAQDFGAALETYGQLRLVYQPRIDLASGACLGAEALLRWHHPLLGDISPAEFIPLVEQTELARPTTAWVIDRALTQLSSWRKAGLDLQLSVNVSATNLDEPDFAERVQAMIAAHDIAPESLELEITESAVMNDGGGAVDRLEAIAAIGVKLAIDDFGTGYSSLAYLQRLPARILKIDRAFVDGCEKDAGKLTLVSAMIKLAHDLGYRVVAEGVETQSSLDRIAALDCDEAQGYFFARPMAPADLEAWIATRERSAPVDRAAA